MPVEKFLQYYPDYKVRADQLAFAKYLQQRGLRFLVDFGFENAERIAWELMPVGIVQ